MKFISKSELAKQLNISTETLRVVLKQIKGINTGRRQLLYPYEVEIIKEAIGKKESTDRKKR